MIALPLVLTSDSGCRFVGTATQDYEGYIREPGGTAGILSFTLAPLLAVAALVLLARAGRPASRIAVAAAVLVFPLALLDFILWVAKGTFGCGLGL